MTHMLAQPGSYIKSTAQNPHVFTVGHSVGHEVVDQVTKGFGLLQMDTDLCKDTGPEAASADITTGADIGVN